MKSSDPIGLRNDRKRSILQFFDQGGTTPVMRA
jgi:hypothetical protein